MLQRGDQGHGLRIDGRCPHLPSLYLKRSTVSKQSAKAEASKEKNAPTSIIVVSELARVTGINVSTRVPDHKTAVEYSKIEEKKNEVIDSSLTVVFIPGSNYFSTPEKLKQFYAVKTHPEFLQMVNEGHLRVIDASKAKINSTTEAPESLVSIDSGPMAITIVQGTMNAELLKTWQDEETRETVKAAIRKQLKLVVEFNAIHEAAQSQAA